MSTALTNTFIDLTYGDVLQLGNTGAGLSSSMLVIRDGLGTATPLSICTDHAGLATAPPATANYGLWSLGAGPFDGATSGFFVGSALGTHFAINAATVFTGDFLRFQLAGATKFSITSAGVGDISTLRVGLIGNTPVVGGSFQVGGNINAFSNSTVTVAGCHSLIGRGTVGVPTAIQSGDFIGAFACRGYDGSAYATGPYIQGVAAENFDASHHGGDLMFLTIALGATTATERGRIDSQGNFVIGTGAISTGATDGFLYIPTCAGTPNGTPTTKTGRVPIVYDTSANKLWINIGGSTWKFVALS